MCCSCLYPRCISLPTSTAGGFLFLSTLLLFLSSDIGRPFRPGFVHYGGVSFCLRCDRYVSSSSYAMYPPPHMPCILLLICHVSPHLDPGVLTMEACPSVLGLEIYDPSLSLPLSDRGTVFTTVFTTVLYLLLSVFTAVPIPLAVTLGQRYCIYYCIYHGTVFTTVPILLTCSYVLIRQVRW